MDWLTTGKSVMGLVKKYACVALILVLGIVLMLLPEGRSRTTSKEETGSQEQTAAPPSVEEALEELLSQIHGAGKVRLLLTVAQGTSTVYQTDTAGAGDSLKVETVILTDSGKSQQGLVRQVNPETYLGAVVVCQGGDSPAVRLAVTQAVAAATSLSTDKITVLKMK